MSLPTRLSPFRPARRFDPVADFEDLFRGLNLRPMPREYESAMEMRMNVTEDDKSYRVSVDMPGIKKEDIEVSVEGNQITISAEVKRDNAQENHKELYSERFSGKAYRSFSLPFEVDSAKSEAHYDGGVLVLSLPKKTNSESKRLPIH